MTTVLRLIASLFKAVFTSISILRTLFFNLFFLALLVFIGYTLLHTDNLVLKDNTILNLKLSGTIVEQPSERDPLGDYAGRLLGFAEQPWETVLQDVLDAVAAAAADPKISAILLDLEDLDGVGLNQLEAIGAALVDFRSSGKPVISAADYYTQHQYYLAAHADTIILNPMGGVDLHGYGLYRFYFKDLLDKLKIDFQVFQVGSYKSALEPITRNSMSAEDRSQSRAWLSSLWSHYLAGVAAQRSLSSEQLSDYVNAIPANLRDTGGDTARLALKYGLVDELKTRPEIRAYLASLSGAESGEEIPLVSLPDYLSRVEPSYDNGGPDADQVALIIAQGTIVDGDSHSGIIGAETVSTLLRQAAKEDRIKAVVLRIDSGGGSALASELIRQEIRAFKQTGKAVLVSMGTYAASGGYWIAADADEIWAAPTTLTGSIGIFMALPTFGNLLNQAGIHRDGVGTTNLASGLDLSRPLAEEIRQAIELNLEHGYERFLEVVAEGRDMDREQVEELAQGKIYAGEQARALGLVDRLGTLEQVIEAAAVRAGLDDFAVTTLRPSRSWSARLLHRFGARAKSLVMAPAGSRQMLGEVRPALDIARSFLLFPDPNGMYAHCLTGYYH